MHCAASASALASDSALVASVQRQCKWRAFLSYDPGLRCVSSAAAAAPHCSQTLGTLHSRLTNQLQTEPCLLGGARLRRLYVGHPAALVTVRPRNAQVSNSGRQSHNGRRDSLLSGSPLLHRRISARVASARIAQVRRSAL